MTTRKNSKKIDDSKIRRFYKTNKYARFWTVLAIFALIAAIFAVTYVMDQKKAIKAGGQTLEQLKRQVESENLANNLKVSYGCRLEPTQKYDKGPTYCAAILTGTIHSPNDQAADNTYANIRSLLVGKDGFANVTNMESNYAFDTENRLHCTAREPVNVSGPAEIQSAQQKYSFEIRCKLHAPFSYFTL